MDDDAIAGYLRELEAALRGAGRPTEPLLDEAAAHLIEDAARIAAAESCGHDEAARRAVARFGSVADVLRSVRRNAPFAASRIARAATVLLLPVLAWEVVGAIRSGEIVWPPAASDLWLSFVAELLLVSWGLWRAIHRGGAPGWLRPALAAQWIFASLMLLLNWADVARFARYWQWEHVGIHHFLLVIAPLWLTMTVQGFAGLRALSRTRSTSAS